MKIRIIDSGIGSAEAHMAKDKALLEGLKEGEVILHLYEWENPLSMTYGYFMRPEKILVKEAFSLGLDMSRRPTGGGFVFHHGDYAFSLLMSSSYPGYSSEVLANYYRVNSLVLKVFHKVFRVQGALAKEEELCCRRVSENFCMAKTSKYDVLLGGKKIGGAAQRKVSQGFLHQGSLFLSGSSREFYEKFLLPEILDEITQEIDAHAFFPLGMDVSLQELHRARGEIKETFIHTFCHEGL